MLSLLLLLWRYPWQFLILLHLIQYLLHHSNGLWTITSSSSSSSSSSFGFGFVVVVNAFVDCENGKTTFRRIDYGEGLCHLFGPSESSYQCCRLCNQVNPNSIAAQYLHPGGKDPFTLQTHTDALCCCYIGGFLVEGSGVENSVYYMERDL